MRMLEWKKHLQFQCIWNDKSSIDFKHKKFIQIKEQKSLQKGAHCAEASDLISKQKHSAVKWEAIFEKVTSSQPFNK